MGSIQMKGVQVLCGPAMPIAAAATRDTACPVEAVGAFLALVARVGPRARARMVSRKVQGYGCSMCRVWGRGRAGGKGNTDHGDLGPVHLVTRGVVRPTERDGALPDHLGAAWAHAQRSGRRAVGRGPA